MAPAPGQLNSRRLVCLDMRSVLRLNSRTCKEVDQEWRFTRHAKMFAAIKYLYRARKGLRSNLNNYLENQVWLMSESRERAWALMVGAADAELGVGLVRMMAYTALHQTRLIARQSF